MLLAGLLCIAAGYAGIRKVPAAAQKAVAGIEAKKLAERKHSDRIAVRGKKKASPARIAAAGQNVLLSEDFSLFTAGSEAAPDGTDLTAADGYIPDEMMQTPGWDGAAIYQAGGCAYIGIVTEPAEYAGETGLIDTPFLDLSGNGGDFTVRFRARAAEAGATDNIVVVGVNYDIDDYTGYDEVTVTDQWKDYEVVIDGGSVNHYVQIYAYEYPIFIDDIEVEQARTGISAPVATGATNVAADGSFTANWNAVADASSYLLSVYSEDSEETGVPEETVTEGFDGIAVLNKKFIDEVKSVFPEGWVISVESEGTSRHLYNTDGNYNSPGISLAFDATGDFLETPTAPADIKNVSFWLKNQSADDGSYVKVEGFDGASWVKLDDIYLTEYDGGSAGAFADVPVSVPGVVKVRLSYVKSAGNCAIDDVAYTYGGAAVARNFLFEDKEVQGTSSGVTGTVAGTQYYYYVKAKNVEFTSAASNIVKVGETSVEPGGLTTPVMLPATDVTAVGFTANWNAVAAADGYAAYVYIDHEALADETYYLYDDDFSGFEEGTVSEPEPMDFYCYLDGYANRTDWYAVMPSSAGGVLALDNSMLDYDFGGLLASPYYDLRNGGGKVDVSFKAMGQDVAQIAVSLCEDSADGMSSTVIDSKTLPVGTAWAEQKVSLTGGTAECYIMIEAISGSGILFLDDMKVSQNLKKGDTMLVPYGYAETELTSVPFLTPDRVAGDKFAYQAAAFQLDGEGDLFDMTDFSELMYVGESSVGTVSGLQARVYADAGGIVVENPGLCDVDVYNVSGVCVYSSRSGEPLVKAALDGKGLYLVKVGGTVVKVLR